MISGPRVTRWVEMKFRTGFVHSHRTPIEHLSIQRINSCLGFRCLCHLDKSDTAGLARVPVHDDRDGFDGSMHCKNFSQLLLRYRDIKVADKNVGHEVILPLMFPNILQLGTHKLIFMTNIAFSHGVVLSERPQVFSLPALGALVHVELHGLALCRLLKPRAWIAEESQKCCRHSGG